MLGKDIKPHDKTLIEHELLEMKIKKENPNMEHWKAHELASEKYDYPKEAMEFAVWMTTSQEGIDAMIANSGIGWSPARDIIGTAREGGSEFFGGQSYNTEVFQPATQQQNPDWSWWPVTQQTFNILADGFRRKTSGGTLVDAIATTEAQVIEVFRNKGLTIRKADR